MTTPPDDRPERFASREEREQFVRDESRAYLAMMGVRDADALAMMPEHYRSVGPNDPGPGRIDAVVTADDVASDRSFYAREVIAEMADDVCAHGCSPTDCRYCDDDAASLGAVVASGWTESPDSDLPPCPLIGTDGNAFAVIGRVSRCLKDAGQRDRAEEWVRDATSQPSYDALLQTVFRYVDPMPATDNDDDRVRVHYPNGSDIGIATFADGRPLLSRPGEPS